MCTYNGEQFVDEQIASILNQDYRNIELLIVDDCSVDSTWLKLQEWQKKSQVMKIFRNEFNLGYNKNFEKAIQLAAGNFIALSDQDDVWLPNKLSKLLGAFSNENVVLAHSRSVRLENGRLDYRKARLQYHFSGNDTRKIFFFGQIMGHDMLLKRELVSKFLPLPEGVIYDWWIAIIATCYGNVAAIQEYLTYHRIHEHSSFFSKTAPSKKRELDLLQTLQLFNTIEALNPVSKTFLNKLLQLILQHDKRNKNSFDLRLFQFLYKHRKIIFSQKRRLFPEISYLKNAVKYARLNYKGKGVLK